MQRTLLRRDQARRRLNSGRCFTKPLVEALEERALLTLTAQLVSDINVEPVGVQAASYRSMAELGGAIYFNGSDGLNGFELWKCASTGGAVLVKDFRPGVESGDPRYIASVNGKLFFLANDGIHGSELWKS